MAAVAYRSASGVTVLKSSICSGGMNGTVPRISPENVKPERPTPRKLLARPKSEILTASPSGSSAIRMFSGLMSRWTNPSWWACSSPLRIWQVRRQACLIGYCPASGLGQRLQVRARDVLHREPELAAGHPLLVAFDDIGMAELADDRHLALEAIDRRAGGGRLGHDQLEGDHLAGQVVPGLVDHAHRAAAQLAQGRVVGNRLRQARRLGAAGRAPPLDRLARRGTGRPGDRQVPGAAPRSPAQRTGLRSSVSGAQTCASDSRRPRTCPPTHSTRTRNTLWPAAITSPETRRTRCPPDGCSRTCHSCCPGRAARTPAD